MGFCWRSKKYNLSYHDIRSFYVRSENAMDSRAGGEHVLSEPPQLFNVRARQKISMASLTHLLNMSSSLARTEEEDISKAWLGIDKINLCQSKDQFQSIRSLRARSSFSGVALTFSRGSLRLPFETVTIWTACSQASLVTG